MTFANGLKL